MPSRMHCLEPLLCILQERVLITMRTSPQQ